MHIDRLYKNLLINFMVMMLPVQVNTMQQESRSTYKDLLTAAKNGDVNSVKLLLEMKVNVDIRDQYRDTPLILASCQDYTDIVDRLLTGNADVNAKNTLGKTALTWASFQDNVDIMDRLIRGDADVNVQDFFGKTALMIASYEGHPDIVKMFLTTSNADVNIQDKYDRTALAYAIKGGEKDVLNILLKYIKDNTDGSIFDIDTLSELLQNATGVLCYKKKNEIVEMVMMFIRYGANFGTGFDGKTFIKKYFPKNAELVIEGTQKGINEYRKDITEVFGNNSLCINAPTALKLIISFVIPIM